MIRIAILGYGNLGRGVEANIQQNDDMVLQYVFTRRNPKECKIITPTAKVLHIDEILNYKEEIDVLILCGGSATDLPKQSVEYAKYFNIIDSFDRHSNIPTHLSNVDISAKEGGKLAILSVGWDPGMFSIQRLYASAILPHSYTYTFWGKGVSQGHSDAIRRIEGVLDARQYTIPIEKALKRVRAGENPELSIREKHLRECFVVVEDGVDRQKIITEIQTMPNYFADYETIVHFISQEEMDKNHAEIPHGGFVISSGKTGWNLDKNHIIEYSLKLDSNPEFTSSVLIAYTRAAYRLYREGMIGAKTVFDIPPIYLIKNTREEMIKELL